MSRSSLLAMCLIGFALSLASIFLLDFRLTPLFLADETNREIWGIITDLGNSGWMAILVIATWLYASFFAKRQPDVPLWPRLRGKASYIFLAVLLPGLLVLVVKILVGRSRPYTGDLAFHPFTPGVDFASWPSGHATTVFSFAVAVGMVFPRLRWPLIAAAALIGYSRLALNMHYLGDVIAGATFGTVGAIMVYWWVAPKLGLK